MLILIRLLAALLGNWRRRGRLYQRGYRQSVMALLVDGENIGPEWAAAIVAKACQFGCPAIRRVYGDWTTSYMASWRAIAECYGFQQVQVPRAVIGKNAVDLALTVDAMDLLFEGLCSFCLVSSDSDYAPLVRRLREAGCFVLGIGRPPVPQLLCEACHVFITTDQLHRLQVLRAGTAPVQEDRTTTSEQPAPAEEPSLPLPLPQAAAGEGQRTGTLPRELLLSAYREATQVSKRHDGWVSESQLGQHLHKQVAQFKPKTYGFRSLRELLEQARAEGLFEIQRSDSKQWYVYAPISATSMPQEPEWPAPAP
ncbi:NYN domain-containing protein [Thermogemmatispora onikobensis]|uniref:NYN domain-containing protein n=1 Tax=Thermogemmatispora onikobensis TaxID=732234 RepID=UPI00159F2B4C|nr:NYN domain-containing protein [Thermogemmatispora onikobensis]